MIGLKKSQSDLTSYIKSRRDDLPTLSVVISNIVFEGNKSDDEGYEGDNTGKD